MKKALADVHLWTWFYGSCNASFTSLVNLVLQAPVFQSIGSCPVFIIPNLQVLCRFFHLSFWRRREMERERHVGVASMEKRAWHRVLNTFFWNLKWDLVDDDDRGIIERERTLVYVVRGQQLWPVWPNSLQYLDYYNNDAHTNLCRTFFDLKYVRLYKLLLANYFNTALNEHLYCPP